MFPAGKGSFDGPARFPCFICGKLSKKACNISATGMNLELFGTGMDLELNETEF